MPEREIEPKKLAKEMVGSPMTWDGLRSGIMWVPYSNSYFKQNWTHSVENNQNAVILKGSVSSVSNYKISVNINNFFTKKEIYTL